MRTDLSVTQISLFPGLPTAVWQFGNEDEYYILEDGVTEVVSPTMGTDTPVFIPQLWGDEQKRYTIVTGAAATYTPISVDTQELEFDFVYTGAANSGAPTTNTYLPHFGITNQAVSEMVLNTGTLVASLAIETPVSGPLEAHFGAVDSNRLSSYYDAFVGNRVSHRKSNNRAMERFARTLKQMIRVEPVIDGYDHPAEGFLQEIFNREPDVARQWFLSALRRNLPPSLVADSMRLLGRIISVRKDWRAGIAAEGLRSASAEVRDAAMQAIESWGDPVLVSVLKDHRQREPRKWLREYADQIIQDLTE